MAVLIVPESGEMMSDQAKAYIDFRSRVEAFAGFWLAAVVILAALAKSPDFTLKDPFGFVGGEIHNGYVAAYGSLIVAIVVFKFHLLLRECLIYRERLYRDTSTHPTVAAHDFPLATEQLLRLPFWLITSRNRSTTGTWGIHLRRAAAVTPVCLFAAGSALFTWFYFAFIRVGHPETHFHDLLLGAGDWKGFRATWAILGIRDGKEVFLNAPQHTWVALAGFAYVLYVGVGFVRYVFKADSPYPKQ